MPIRNSLSHASGAHGLNAGGQGVGTGDVCQLTAGNAGRSTVVERVASILTEISRNGSRRCRLKDLALGTGIARPSVHRILNDLIRVGFVVQNPDRTYALGETLFTLGLSAASPIHDLNRIRELAQQLADSCGDVVYVALRQFGGVHYLVRAEGHFTILTHTINVGDVKAFTSSYSGIALLAHMSPDERQPYLNRLVLDASPAWIEEHRIRLRRTLSEKIIEVETHGYCAGPHVVMPGIAGIAACIPSSSRTPYMALSISAVENRLDAERIRAIAPSLLKTARAMSAFII